MCPRSCARLPSSSATATCRSRAPRGSPPPASAPPPSHPTPAQSPPTPPHVQRAARHSDPSQRDHTQTAIRREELHSRPRRGPTACEGVETQLRGGKVDAASPAPHPAPFWHVREGQFPDITSTWTRANGATRTPLRYASSRGRCAGTPAPGGRPDVLGAEECGRPVRRRDSGDAGRRARGAGLGGLTRGSATWSATCAERGAAPAASGEDSVSGAPPCSAGGFARAQRSEGRPRDRPSRRSADEGPPTGASPA